MVTLAEKVVRSLKAQPLEIEHIVTEVLADPCRYPLEEGKSIDIGGRSMGKGQLHPHLTHLRAYYCNSRGPGLPCRLTKQNLNPLPHHLISM